MSKNTKRQRKLEDMFGSSSTKRKKENNDNDTPIVDKQSVENSASKLFRRIWII